MRRPARTPIFLAALLFALLGCGGGAVQASSGSAPSGEPARDLASGYALERFFPLVNGMIYHYVTENDAGDRGILVARVVRTDEKTGELRFPQGRKVIRFTPEGVAADAAGGPTYLLKEPVTVGTSWRGEHGGTTRITSVDASVSVPAGSYTGCIQTLEERLGDQPVRFTTTFCPAVGIVLLEAAGRQSSERAALKSYAAPIAMKPDGIDRIQVAPSPDTTAPRPPP